LKLVWRGPALSVSRGCPARGFQRPDDSQIDYSYIVLLGAESSPRRERIAHAAQAQGSGKIIPATGGDDQNRQGKFDQLTQVTVDGAIATEE